MTNFAPEIAEKIRNTVIFEGLELEELGIEVADIKDNTLLYDVDGLDLDSVDALEVLAGVQREFGVVFPEIDSDFITDHASTVGKLAASVSLQLDKAVAA